MVYMTIVVHMIILKYIKEIIFYFYKFRRKNEQSRSLWVDLYKFRVKNKIIQNVKDQNTKKKQKWLLMFPSFYSAATAREIRSRRWKNCCNATEEMTRWINTSEEMTKKITTYQGLRRSKRRRYAFTASIQVTTVQFLPFHLLHLFLPLKSLFPRFLLGFLYH